MNRWLIAFSLSISFVALGVAGFALFESRSGGTESRGTQEQDLHELAMLVNALQEKVAEHEAAHDVTLDARTRRTVQRETLQPHAMSHNASTQEADEPGEAVSLPEQVAALTERLRSLEDEETIARLAQSGRAQVAEKELESALDQVLDPDVSPDGRLGAWKSVRRLWETDKEVVVETADKRGLRERDLVVPMIELAQDRTLESDFRVDVLRNLHGSRTEELRQPMLDLLNSYDTPEVRSEALTVLMWQLDDAKVREAITAVSQGDHHEEVQAKAEEFLPKVEHVAKEIAESARTGEAGQKK